MRRTTLIYALVLLVAVTAVVAMPKGKPASKPVGCFAACQKALGLSQGQVAKMTTVRTSFMKDTANLRADLQAKMKEMAGLWAAKSPDLRLIKQKAASADRIRAEIRDKAIDARGAILKDLTPTQRAKCIKQCQSGQCCCGMCGMCGGLGMGMGGMNGGGGMGMMGGQGMVKGRGGAGMDMGGGCPMR